MATKISRSCWAYPMPVPASCASEGIKPPSKIVTFHRFLPSSSHTDAHIESGYHTAKTLLSDHPDITGLVVYNDVRAAGVLRACKELGISIPDQLSIISHDNIALSSLLIPSLTTVDIPKQALGEAAIDMMLKMMEDPTKTPETLTFTPKLIIRESCP
jgi:DNA-binding LacI/PurR family transcriptional regulator